MFTNFLQNAGSLHRGGPSANYVSKKGDTAVAGFVPSGNKSKPKRCRRHRGRSIAQKAKKPRISAAFYLRDQATQAFGFGSAARRRMCSSRNCFSSTEL